MRTIRVLVAFGVVLGIPGLLMSIQVTSSGNEPTFGADNELRFPENYREWIWLSSGLGMAYGPSARAAANPLFDNVFVTPEAYRAFVQTGTWPDKTMFVLELRSSASEGSINKQGRFQGDLVDVEVEVKDQKRFSGKWAFFAFGRNRTPVKPLPNSAQCYSCHAENGAVDNTFVQFYPTLFEIAKAKGTVRVK